jgi:asparagine N-glycosylation enzyme membrane subunit Stt3
MKAQNPPIFRVVLAVVYVFLMFGVGSFFGYLAERERLISEAINAVESKEVYQVTHIKSFKEALETLENKEISLFAQAFSKPPQASITQEENKLFDKVLEKVSLYYERTKTNKTKA